MLVHYPSLRGRANVWRAYEPWREWESRRRSARRRLRCNIDMRATPKPIFERTSESLAQRQNSWIGF